MSPSFITFEIRYTQSRCAFVLQFLTSQCHSNILPCSPTLTQSVIFVSLAPNLLYSMTRFLWSLRLLQTRVEVLCLLWRYPILKDKYASLAVLCQVNIISYCLIHMCTEGTGKCQRISQLGLWERSPPWKESTYMYVASGQTIVIRHMDIGAESQLLENLA